MQHQQREPGRELVVRPEAEQHQGKGTQQVPVLVLVLVAGLQLEQLLQLAWESGLVHWLARRWCHLEHPSLGQTQQVWLLLLARCRLVL